MNDIQKAELEEYKALPLEVRRIIDDLTALRESQRRDVLDKFCRYCGRKDPGCQCWNDE
jgi:hypothetical protein